MKARCDSIERAKAVAESLGCRALPDQRQQDTYFHCPTGRLKLRQIDGQPAQLIWYDRRDRADARSSTYFVLPVDDPAALKTLLERALGVRATVRKHRAIYLFRNARIHLDQVSGLGTFIEIEAVLEAPGEEAEGRRLVSHLRKRFGIQRHDLLSRSYSDMLENAGP